MALPGYLEDTAKDYAKQALQATYNGTPIETSTFTGGLDASGQRAAGPGITGINPYVAQMDPLTNIRYLKSSSWCRKLLTLFNSSSGKCRSSRNSASRSWSFNRN